MNSKIIKQIGTSGWNYKHWSGEFYPRDLSPLKLLSYYAERFSTVEINNSFYRVPKKKTFAHWRDSVPEDFVFSVKATRFITHKKNFKDTRQALGDMLDAIDGLGDKLGVILFQLPSKWNINEKRFSKFVEILPEGYRFAFEFRNTTWFHDSIYEIMDKKDLIYSIYQYKGILSPEVVSADTVYVRLHGPYNTGDEEMISGKYSTEQLEEWAQKIRNWDADGKDVFCYFDNDEECFALENAEEMKNILAEE